MENASGVTVLVVEDEGMIRALLEDAFEDAGFEAVIAHSGEEALGYLEADAARFRAVLTDIRLGGHVDGWQVAVRARELMPYMPVVYMSGDSAADWRAKGVPGSTMVVKPFSPTQVVVALATLLNHPDLSVPPQA